jgi:DNA-binding GntR family transcriptional regulator
MPTPDHPGGTVADGVYKALVEAILFGDLAGSRRLLLHDLAERFQISLTPVREALQALAADGFIEATPRRGYRVRVPSPRHVAELWQVRLGLELTAAELAVAAPEGHAMALSSLRRIQADLDGDAGLSHRRHVELNALFHQTLVAASGNLLLSGVYHGIQMQLLGAWVQRGSDAWRQRLVSERREHLAIIKAFAARDSIALAAQLRRHLGRSLDDALRDIAVAPPTDAPDARS